MPGLEQLLVFVPRVHHLDRLLISRDHPGPSPASSASAHWSVCRFAAAALLHLSGGLWHRALWAPCLMFYILTAATRDFSWMNNFRKRWT
jgi:hypothetical protein